MSERRMLLVDAEALSRARIALNAFGQKSWRKRNDDLFRALTPQPDGEAIEVSPDGPDRVRFDSVSEANVVRAAHAVIAERDALRVEVARLRALHEDPRAVEAAGDVLDGEGWYSCEDGEVSWMSSDEAYDYAAAMLRAAVVAVLKEEAKCPHKDRREDPDHGPYLLRLRRRGEAVSGPWVQTYSGLAFDLLDPKPEQVSLEDIAHALSQICRFTGHTRTHYSVAEHSVRVSWCALGLDPEEERQALLHDAAEAYIGDVSTPLKQALRRVAVRMDQTNLATIEGRVWDAIVRRFGLDPHLGHRSIQRWDLTLLATEARDLLGPSPRPWATLEGVEPLAAAIEPWSAEAAKVHFLARAAELGIR